MSVRHLTLSALLAAISLTSFASDSEAANRREPFELLDGDRVVLLGGTFFERAQRYGYLETAMQLRFPERKFSVRNLGWSGDTVFAESRGIFDPPAKGYARMIDQVKGLKPTVIFLHYGGNESFNGEAYLDTFVKQYEKLLDDLAPTGADMVLVSPLPLWKTSAPLPDVEQFNPTRAKFYNAVQELADNRSLQFLSLSERLSKEGLPAWSHILGSPTTHDGATLTSAGYLLAAHDFCEELFGRTATNQSGHAEVSRPSEALKLNAKAPHSPLVLKSLPPNGSAKTTVRFSPSNMQRGILNLKFSNDIPFGHYELRVDGEPQRSFAYVEGGGLLGGPSVVPVAFVADRLRKAVIEKNQMYFHRWRPQNVTYLFLFRKHEQGNNAKEVEEFERIVAKLDDRIFELKQKPVEVTVEIVRVGDADADQ